MATLVLGVAGGAVGSAIGGTVLGLSAGVIGQAVGATAGRFIDQAILGGGSAAVETGRASSLRLQSSTEGTPVPMSWGRMRVAGQIIWSTRFLEQVRETSQGGKGVGAPSQTVREFSYSISCAVGLCEGPIDRIGRVWADGALLDTSTLTMRVYNGTEDQQPDMKIQAVEGAETVPAYRGLAYVVFEDLPVGPFGNRIPQLNFEVFRSAQPGETVDPEEAGRPVRELIKGVALSPGTGEFSLETEPVQYVFPGGAAQFANVNTADGRTDFEAAMEQLEGDLPDCETVSLVVTWFGDDLRCGHCTIQPKIEFRDRQSTPVSWTSAGLTTADAPLISQTEGRPDFGGTPSDRSIIRAIQHLNARGIRVMVYPFLLMDVPEGNGRPDPYSGAADQPVFPWRGRITLDAAPGEPGSTDQTAAATGEVAAFFGQASASDFTVGEDAVTYSGPADWGYRRFVLHLAALAKAAGGVDSICVGTEMRSLTQIRSARTAYPAVDQFKALAAEVRTLLPAAKLGYAADWSEYFGHQPGDGSGDAIFHLDPLWADPNIDFVGIDDYTPLSDWRYGTAHADAEAGAKSIYSLPYLEGNVEGGEYYDWFYASQSDRDTQTRTPITDGAHGEPWVYRAKDVRAWWSNPHHNRVGGVREPVPTGWVPQSKPVWLTETGCPAVDMGANQPNLFFDGRSSESALPHASLGARDDEMQRRYLQAKLGYWDDPARNPVSTVYGGPMIPAEAVYVWTWDARPWPDFPVRESLWADGPAYRLGHWISGRISANGLAEVVAEICTRSGLDAFDVGGLYGTVSGYVLDETRSAREALQPLMLAYGFEAFESAGQIVFQHRGSASSATFQHGDLVAGEGDEPALDRTRASGGSANDVVRTSYVQSENDYRLGAAEARLPNGSLERVADTSLPLCMAGAQAQLLVDRWLAESHRSRDTAAFALPPSDLAAEPGDVVTVEAAGRPERWRIERIVDGTGREVEAVRVESALYLPAPRTERSVEPELIRPPGPVEAVFLDLPSADGQGTDHQPWLAVAADPWPGQVAVYRSADDDGYGLFATVAKPAIFGALVENLAPAAPARWSRASVRVRVASGALSSATRLAVLNGANRLAVEVAPGTWELLQYREAELVDPGEYRLSQLLRGQRGTEDHAEQTIPADARIVVLDDALVRLPVPLDELGLARHYRIGPARYGFDHATFVHRIETATGVGLRPFAPTHLRVRAEGGDLALTWIRRSRVGGDSWEGVDVPLGEEQERYRVRVFQGGTRLRTAKTSDTSFTYTAAMQAEDGVTGPIEFRVSQLSNTYGYGPESGVTNNG